MLFELFIICWGIALLYFGADYLLKGAISMGLKLKIHRAFLGIVVVGFGTSLPELLVSIKSAFLKHSDIAYANLVGSNIANVFLILSCAILLSPFKITKVAKIEKTTLLVSNILFIVFLLFFTFNIITSIILIVTSIFYLINSYQNNKKVFNEELVADGSKQNIYVLLAFIVCGLLALSLGASLLIDGSVYIAKNLGISEKVIGITLVAVGTSLPELAATIVAALKRHSDVALYNVIGSNIFNITLIPALVGIVSSFKGGLDFAIDGFVYLLALFSLLGLIKIYQNKITPKFIGLGFLLVYATYIIILVNF